jgi:hypothetical protein
MQKSIGISKILLPGIRQPASFDEYVDISQVQQLLIDNSNTSPATSSTSVPKTVPIHVKFPLPENKIWPKVGSHQSQTGKLIFNYCCGCIPKNDPSGSIMFDKNSEEMIKNLIFYDKGT